MLLKTVLKCRYQKITIATAYPAKISYQLVELLSRIIFAAEIVALKKQT